MRVAGAPGSRSWCTGAISSAPAWVYMHPTTKPEPKRASYDHARPRNRAGRYPAQVVALLDDLLLWRRGPWGVAGPQHAPGRTQRGHGGDDARRKPPPPIETQEPPPKTTDEDAATLIQEGIIGCVHDATRPLAADHRSKRRRPEERLHKPNWIANTTPARSRTSARLLRSARKQRTPSSSRMAPARSRTTRRSDQGRRRRHGRSNRRQEELVEGPCRRDRLRHDDARPGRRPYATTS